MREILFRGKSKVQGSEWLYGDVLIYENSAQIWETINGRKHNSVVSLETIGQYTGLTDKNGNKIFEGDIVNEYDMPEKISNTGIVKWSNMFVGWHISQTRSMYCHECMSYEVIGNIHDNPELLEGNNE